MSTYQAKSELSAQGHAQAFSPVQTANLLASAEAAVPAPRRQDGEPASEGASKRSSPSKKEPSKQDAVLARLKSPRGVTIAKLMEITGWQKHTIRGFLSAVVRKKLAFDLTSETGRDGERRYRIARPAREVAR
ncbi:DUF3489 domain-containing protein [Shinella sp.]|uniref:DUF3489 domain-containing protein n=1 Tax=Shinella sp. TaxID=1870904 RepID=UPI003F6EBBFF